MEPTLRRQGAGCLRHPAPACTICASVSLYTLSGENTTGYPGILRKMLRKQKEDEQKKIWNIIIEKAQRGEMPFDGFDETGLSGFE
jgi:hypothetical protein